jgi:hypothetical protein
MVPVEFVGVFLRLFPEELHGLGHFEMRALPSQGVYKHDHQILRQTRIFVNK